MTSNFTLSRRTLLRSSAAGAALIGAPFLASCASPGGSASPTGAALRELSFRLGWTPNAEFAGYYTADSAGIYAQHQLATTFLPGGPGSPVSPVVSTGKALIGVDPIPENVAAATTQGAKLAIVGAQFQTSPEALTSLATKPIEKPADLVGKNLGVQLNGKDHAITFLKVNGVDPSKVNLVVVQSDPAPLVTGEIDAYWGLATNQPIVLAARGVKTHTMLLGDFGYNRMQGCVVCTTATLADAGKRAMVKDFLLASQAGWAQAIADPAKAADLVVNNYGKDQGLDATAQANVVKAMAPLIQPKGAQQGDIFRMSDTLIKQTTDTLKLMGVPIPDGLFVTDLF